MGDLGNLSGDRSIFQSHLSSNGSMMAIRAEFRLNPDDLFALLTVNPKIVLERIAIFEIPMESLITPKTMR
jgi:hypothetical protein